MHFPVTSAKILEKLHNLPLLRPSVTSIDPVSTTVLCFSSDFASAVEHYAAYCHPLPEFRILDWDRYDATFDGHPRAFSAADLSAYAHKEKCLYVAPQKQPWMGFIPAARTATALGITQYFVDSIVSRDFPWIHGAALDHDMLQAHWDTITHLYNCLADENSRHIFLANLKLRLTQNIGYVPISTYPQYHHPQVALCAGNVVIDGGLGNDLPPSIEFSKIVGPNGRVVSFEPVLSFCSHAQEAFKAYPNITVVNQGLWNTRTQLRFQNTNDDGAHLASITGEQGNTLVETTNVDFWLEEHDLPCHFLKLDIEGAEPDALRGAERTLRRWRPKLAVCVYHRPFEQIFTIFEYLQRLDLGYTFFMGHHSPHFTETVLYASVLPEQDMVKNMEHNIKKMLFCS